MKKAVSFISVCLVLVCVLAMAVAPVSAATPKEDIIAAAKAAIPAAYQAKYLPVLENVLQQVDVDANQATEVIQNIQAAKAAVSGDKGDSVSYYTATEQGAVVDQVKEACTTLGLKAEVKPAENPSHEGDVELVILTQQGQPVGTIDLDVKKTNSAVDYTLVFAAGALAVAAIAAAVYGKKLVTSR